MGNNIILLGGSNSVITTGLQKGIREGIEKLNKHRMEDEKLEFYNFALGTTTHIQNFYELKRERNQEIFKNAELIITESNINDTNSNARSFGSREKLSLSLIYRNLNWYYGELYSLKKKILVIILPTHHYGNSKIINAIHKKTALKFGFNCIDMQEYVDNHKLSDFFKNVDRLHMMPRIMCEFGKSIISNLESFKLSNLSVEYSNPKFTISTPKDMEIISGTLKEKQEQNSLYSEVVYCLKEGETLLRFKRGFKGLVLIGVHTWNRVSNNDIPKRSESILNYSSLKIFNQRQVLIKELHTFNCFLEMQKIFSICDETFVNIDHYENKGREFHYIVHSWREDANKLPFCNLIAFFLASPDGNYYEESVDFEALRDEVIVIPQEYYHNFIIPPIETYKEIVEEYCSIMDPRKLKPLQDQINQLKGNIATLINEKRQLNNLNAGTLVIGSNTAKSRIHSHLSYKLGRAMIENSKSFLGYIRMPYVLSYITEQHNKEQKQYREKIKKNPKVKLPQLESYPDYKEALKEKECFTYKLGEALIKANNTSFIGGGGAISSYYLIS
ncbi:hypothetical protein [uncultured Helicobacter sp.]|uniref:hypothetical protein n=1 Tax=uncultured Helicobacter sp. TaxID=175537 RepID=UPI002636BA6D|nr:hypothetical protein [uncultured Helicobacter sp.]